MSMPPIYVADLFPEITCRLLELLRSLTPEEWDLPTVSSQRTVKDIVSHLLDGSLRRLSMQRDGYQPPDSRPQTGEMLMDFLNRLNREWEVGTRRLSPRVIVALIEWADAQLAQLLRSLDPHEPAIFPVAWAGEEQSENWMDVAREFTEKWHHTQQIFHATARTSTILDKTLGAPCFGIFMRALPFTFREASAAANTLVTVTIQGEAGGSWHIERLPEGWRQLPYAARPAQATVVMTEDDAWKLVTKRRSLAEARQQFPAVEVHGNQDLGSHVFQMVSVMA